MNNFDDLLNSTPVEGQPRLSTEDYAAKKQAERDNIFDLADDTAMGVAGNGGDYQQYLNVQSTFSRYSAVNALLIYAQQELLPKEKATQLGDYDYWKEKGCFVRAKSVISILEPREYTKEDGSPGTSFDIKKVFDISQVDTRKLKKSAPAQKPTERQILAALVKSSPIAIVGVENLPSDVGAVRRDERIEVRKGMGFEDTFRCLAQEICAHHLETGPDVQEDSHFSAYSAAYILCKKNSVDIQGFDFSDTPAVMSGLDAQQIKGELAQIRDCADDISGSMARQFRAQAKAAKSQEAR